MFLVVASFLVVFSDIMYTLQCCRNRAIVSMLILLSIHLHMMITCSFVLFPISVLYDVVVVVAGPW